MFICCHVAVQGCEVTVLTSICTSCRGRDVLDSAHPQKRLSRGAEATVEGGIDTQQHDDAEIVNENEKLVGSTCGDCMKILAVATFD